MQVFSFVGSQYSQRQADERPHMHDAVIAFVVFAEFVNLCMAVVASGDAVIRTGCLDLIVFESAEFQAVFLESGLQKPAAAAAAIIVGSIGDHVDKIFFTHNRFHDETEIFRDGIAIAFTDNLAGVLDRELDFQILVPVGTDFEFSFPDPFGIVFVDVFYFEFVFDIEFFQSGPD